MAKDRLGQLLKQPFCVVVSTNQLLIEDVSHVMKVK